jgi:hypothetical protein
MPSSASQKPKHATVIKRKRQNKKETKSEAPLKFRLISKSADALFLSAFTPLITLRRYP